MTSKHRKPKVKLGVPMQTDSHRRDLTINALYYDISRQEIIDYVGGISDLEQGLVRTVGPATQRFDEDRLRILRAIRFVVRLGSGLDKETEDAIKSDNSLAGISSERIREEFLKSIKSAKSVRALHRLYDTFNLWEKVFPGLKINSWYKETKNIPVQIALLLRDNDPKLLAAKLNKLKYSSLETKQIVFLTMFKQLSPATAPSLKKLWGTTRLTKEDLKEFAMLAGEPKKVLVDAFNSYELSVKGHELMKLGFSGQEIGREIIRREIELFTKLL